MRLRLYYGLAALTFMQLLGPRPAFVKTAYAAAPAVTVEQLSATECRPGSVDLVCDPQTLEQTT